MTEPELDAHAQPPEAVLAALGSDAARGLSASAARERLARHGSNRLREAPRTSVWRRFLAQFTNPLVLLLVVAAGISALLWLIERDTALPYEATAIFAIVLLNAGIGYVQQARAEEAVAALREMSAAQARVVRDGRPQSIPAAELVPGDIVNVEEGDTIPADGRVLESVALQVAEAALTGESAPIAKDVAPLEAETSLGDRRNMLFSGTSVTYGRGRAVVIATGMRTEMGRIAGMLEATKEAATPLQEELDRVGKLLGLIVLIIAVVMIGTIFAVSDVTTFSDVFDVLILGVALAVAAVPEGLPAIVTAVLALGVQRMAARNAIVRHLAAVETLGSTDVIASDKTGTLTRNEMTVRAVVTASGRAMFEGTGYAPDGTVSTVGGGPIDGALRLELERALTIAERVNNAALTEQEGHWTPQGDPTEAALLTAARKAGLDPAALDARHARLAEVPFSSERKLMSTVHADTERSGTALVMTKGAADVLLDRCVSEQTGDGERPLTPERRAAIRAANNALADEALRTLGVAYRVLEGEDAADAGTAGEQLERDLVFAGLIGLLDPPRDEAKEAVARAKGAGIHSIMITGDHPHTAAVIAAELGIGAGGPAVTGTELETMSDEALDRAVEDVAVFARVNPEHKLRIVDALQRHGLTVAMTGDGVNDAPALKSADIGIAMGITGTDVSKQAGDIILADDNYATIVAAVEEGRAIFANIRKFLRYLLSSNVGEVLTMFFGVLLASWLGLSEAAGDSALVLPLLATQILWINLVTDGAPALVLGLDPPDPDTMARPPRPPHEGVLTRRMWRGIFFVGSIFAIGTLLVLDASLPGGLIAGEGDLSYGQTMAFTTLVLFSLFNVFNARSDERSAFSDLFANAWLWVAVALGVVLQILVV